MEAKSAEKMILKALEEELDNIDPSKLGKKSAEEIIVNALEREIGNVQKLGLGKESAEKIILTVLEGKLGSNLGQESVDRIIFEALEGKLGSKSEFGIENAEEIIYNALEKGVDSVEKIFTSYDSEYLKNHLGIPLTLALAEIAAKKPTDPIHYLGHWLFKWRYNEEHRLTEEDKVIELNIEREKYAEELMEKQRIKAERITLQESEREARENIDHFGQLIQELVLNSMQADEQESKDMDEDELTTEAQDAFESYNEEKDEE